MDTSGKQFPDLKLREHCMTVGGKILKIKRLKAYCELVFPSNIRQYTHKTLPV